MENIGKALVALQGELTPVGKSASNPFFKSKYAPLDEVMATIQPLLAKHKLMVAQLMDNIDGQPALTTIVIHESGESLKATSPLLLTKNDPQAHGSAVTYARRYGIMSALGIVADEDDDGNRASPVSNGAGDEILSRAKNKINIMLEKHGYDTAPAKQLFIKGVLKKETIDNLNDCDSVADALDNEEKRKGIRYGRNGKDTAP